MRIEILTVSLLTFLAASLTAATGSSSETKWENSLECGFSNATRKSVVHAMRIVGGKEAVPHSWPWLVRLGDLHAVSKKTKAWKGSCGGSIINKRWILTAAHCFTSKEAGTVYGVYIGAHSLRRKTGTEKMMTADHVIIHERFDDPYDYSNDVALLHLSEDIPFDNNVRTVCLSDDTATPSIGTECTVAGWGKTQSNVDPSLLYEVSLPVMNMTQCNTYPGYEAVSDTQQLCIGFENGTKDSCSGDSGGPLVYKNDAGRWYQAGIVSFGIGCAGVKRPGIYTKVANYVSWIEENIRKEIVFKVPDVQATLPENKPKDENATSDKEKTSEILSAIAKPIDDDNISSLDQKVTLADDEKLTISSLTLAGHENSLECGFSNATKKSAVHAMRIVGGTEAVPHSWPWLVRFGDLYAVSKKTKTWKGSCGGSIINKRWILTAAHCFSRKEAGIVYGVYIGAHSLRRKTGTEKMMTADHVIIHEKFNDPYDYSNDIALLHLSEDIPFDNNVRTVCLSDDTAMPSIGTECTVAGWGNTQSNVDPSLLYEVSLPVMNMTQCNTYPGYEAVSDTQQLCVGYENGTKDSCTGDSGGPLSYKNAAGRWYQAGIVSFGIGCAGVKRPGIYTKVANYFGWIGENINKEIVFKVPEVQKVQGAIPETIAENNPVNVNDKIEDNTATSASKPDEIAIDKDVGISSLDPNVHVANKEVTDSTNEA